MAMHRMPPSVNHGPSTMRAKAGHKVPDAVMVAEKAEAKGAAKVLAKAKVRDSGVPTNPCPRANGLSVPAEPKGK